MRLNEEMRRLAREDEQFFAALQRLVELRGIEASAPDADAASRPNRSERR